MQMENAAGFPAAFSFMVEVMKKVKRTLLAGYQRHRPACGRTRSHEISVGGSVVHLITCAERIR
jgi:hypothetical protein